MRTQLEAIFSQSVELMTSAHEAIVSKRRVKKLAAHLADFLPRDSKILDIGSGNGRLVRRVLELRPDLDIQGVDVVCAPSSTIPIKVYDGKTLPFDTDSWQVCMACDVLHHCDNPILVLREMRRVAKDAIVLKDHLADSHISRALLCVMDWVGNFGYGTKVPFNFFSSSEWQEAYTELGLTKVHSRTKLRLYPYPVTWILDANLHFVVLLSVNK